MDLKIAKLLNEFDLKGTFYIPIKWGMKTLSDSDIKSISKTFEIGSHSFSHRRMPLISEDEKQFEASESKKILESLIRKEVTSFAYPFGWHDMGSTIVLRKAGYQYARTISEGNSSKSIFLLSADISLNLTNRYINPFRLFLRMSKYSSFTYYKAVRKIIDTAKKNDVIHIAGHSWEFAESDKFERLVDIIEYVSKKRVKPITNSEIARI